MLKDHDAEDLLESASIVWNRDWDALLIGFVLGVLATLAVIGLRALGATT